MSKQVVYRGSFCKIEKPKILKTKYTKDFGVGFYCTVLKEQAKKWVDKYDNSLVNCYEYFEDKSLKMVFMIIFLTVNIGFLLILR